MAGFTRAQEQEIIQIVSLAVVENAGKKSEDEIYQIAAKRIDEMAAKNNSIVLWAPESLKKMIRMRINVMNSVLVPSSVPSAS